MPIAEFERTLKGGDRRFGHAEYGITTCQIIPGDRSIRQKPNEPSVHLKSAAIESASREVIGVDTESVGEKRVAFENPAEEFEFEVELTLLAKPTRGGFGDRAI